MTTRNVNIKNAETDLWFDFVAKVKKEGKTVWDVIKPFIQDYIKR